MKVVTGMNGNTFFILDKDTLEEIAISKQNLISDLASKRYKVSGARLDSKGRLAVDYNKVPMYREIMYFAFNEILKNPEWAVSTSPYMNNRKARINYHVKLNKENTWDWELNSCTIDCDFWGTFVWSEEFKGFK